MPHRWIGAAVLLAALTAFGVQTGIVTRTGFLMGDFRAFYCAARVAAHGANPYHTEPLRSCETAIGPKRFFEQNPGVTIPAPLPGYAIGALEPIALLPFGVAASLWGALLVVATVACIAALAACTGLSWEIVLAAFALSVGMLSLPFGEVVPLALACIAMAAYFASRGRWRAASLLGAGAMIEPHLGLPVCIALAVWRPATRIPLAVSFGALVTVSLIALGLRANLEYFTSVLPAHALSEITRDTQYSLSAVLAALGVSSGIAVRAGALWYIAMLVAGSFVAGKLARRMRNDAVLVCLPPAFAVFGGTFIHITQIAAAIPAALLLSTSSARAPRTLAVVALLMVVVPWGWAISPALIFAPAVVGYLAWRYWSENLVAALLAAIATAAICLSLSVMAQAASNVAAHAAAPFIDSRLAEASWSTFTQKNSTGSLAAWALRLPTWIGLAFILVLSIREAGILRIDRRYAPALLIATCCTLLPITGQLYGDRSAGWLMVDFRAYYCASLAQREHFDPYLVQPLHDCERATPGPYYRAPPTVTVPAPYPPYALALLYPLTLAPFGVATVLWWTFLAGALACAAGALARLTAQPPLVAWAGLALSAGLTSFASGNVMPVALAALIVAALGMVRGRFVLAAAATAVALIEPQIALPAALALFVASRRIRVPLALAVGALAAVAWVTVGYLQTLSYLTAVLPAHALSEVSRDNQYSLSTVLAALGVPEASAVLGGSICYAIMVALGVLVAVRLARRYDDLGFLVLVPPAFALLGGSFVHTEAIAAAVPACLLLGVRAPAYRNWIFATLIVLAVPWMLATSAAMFLAPLFPVAYLAYAFWRQRTVALGAALVSFAAIAALFMLASGMPPHSFTIGQGHATIDPHLAEFSWRQFVLGNVTNAPVTWLLRLPSWAGLVAFDVAAIVLALRTPMPVRRLAPAIPSGIG